MVNVHDVALAIKNLRMDYRNSIAVVFEGKVFIASIQLIMWIERQLAFKARNQNRAYDLEGYPVHVQDLKGLLKALTDRLTEADNKYLAAQTQLSSQMRTAFTDLPPVPENEE